MGLVSSVCLVAGSMLGIGIFLTPPLVASYVADPWSFFALWVVVGLVALAGAVAYAELGAMMPRAGGDYVFLRRAYGPSVSFACGWVIFGAVFTGSIASLAVPLCQYQVPALLAPWFVLDPEATWLGLAWPRWVGIGVIFVVTGVNILGARLSAWLQNLTTLVPMAALTLGAIWVLLFWQAPELVAPVEVAKSSEVPVALGWALSAMAIYFAYSGWNAVIYVAGEVKKPARTLPLSLMLGTGLIMALYLLLCAAFVKVLGMSQLAQAGEVGTAVAQAVGGSWAGWGMTALIAFGLLGTLNGTILGGARVAWAMARKGAFWSWASTAEGDVPRRALLIQGVWASLFVMSWTFEAIVSLVSLAMLLIGSITVGAVFVLRHREPEAERPYRAWGYPVVPALYMLVSAAVMVVMVFQVWAEPTWKNAFPLLGVLVLACAYGGHLLQSGGYKRKSS